MPGKKTKIICTIGPSCSDAETLRGMVEAGMNVARLNFSHGTQQEQAEKIRLVQSVRDELGVAQNTALGLLPIRRLRFTGEIRSPLQPMMLRGMKRGSPFPIRS